MRALLPVLSLAALGGCAHWMPDPDPSQAWVELAPHGSSQLQAIDVDQTALDDDRFFQVPPGAHQLGMHYRFKVDAANVGGQALERECRLTLDYDRFAAGQRYRLVAGGYGFRPWAKLYDDKHFLLARSVERGCGDSLAER